MLSQRTVNIVMLCKGCSNKYDTASLFRNIACYMGNECALEADAYHDKEIKEIIVIALKDVLNNVMYPSSFIDYFIKPSSSQDFLNNAISFLLTLRIKNDDGYYINGFSQELIDESNKVLNIKL